MRTLHGFLFLFRVTYLHADLDAFFQTNDGLIAQERPCLVNVEVTGAHSLFDPRPSHPFLERSLVPKECLDIVDCFTDVGDDHACVVRENDFLGLWHVFSIFIPHLGCEIPKGNGGPVGEIEGLTTDRGCCGKSELLGGKDMSVSDIPNIGEIHQGRVVADLEAMLAPLTHFDHTRNQLSIARTENGGRTDGACLDPLYPIGRQYHLFTFNLTTGIRE